MLKLSADRLTVPAGGTASVQVTSDTTHTGPDGLYTGQLTATAGSQQVAVPLVADKEVESYDVTVTVLGADGKPAPADRTYVGFTNLDTLESSDPGRVAKGKYGLDVTAFGPNGEHYRMIQPEVTISRDAKLTVDLRKAKPVKITVPRADAGTFVVFFGYELTNKAGDKALTFNFQPEGEKLFLGRMGGPASVRPLPELRRVVRRQARRGRHADGHAVRLRAGRRTRGQFFDGLQRRIFTDRQLGHRCPVQGLGGVGLGAASAVDPASRPSRSPASMQAPGQGATSTWSLGPTGSRCSARSRTSPASTRPVDNMTRPSPPHLTPADPIDGLTHQCPLDHRNSVVQTVHLPG